MVLQGTIDRRAVECIHSSGLAVIAAICFAAMAWVIVKPAYWEKGEDRARQDLGVVYDRRYSDLTRWRTPDSNYFRSASGEFLIGKPDRTRCARWVLERLDQDSLAGSADRGDDDWWADDQVPVEYRATNADYRNSGFDRGHLAASANHDSSERAQKATFVLSNCVPQTPELNRRVLAGLETYIRDRVVKGEVCWCITLPVWKKDAQGNICARTIGEGGIWVPTHICKSVIWAPDKRRSHDVQVLTMETWIVPNDDDIPGKFDRYKVSANSAESITGLNLWSGLPDDVEDELESK